MHVLLAQREVSEFSRTALWVNSRNVNSRRIRTGDRRRLRSTSAKLGLAVEFVFGVGELNQGGWSVPLTLQGHYHGVCLSIFEAGDLEDSRYGDIHAWADYEDPIIWLPSGRDSYAGVVHSPC